MTLETQQAIAAQLDEIMVGGYELQGAIAAIRAEGGFIPTMTRATTNSDWTLKIHWPETTAGELPLGTQRQPARRSDEHTTDEDH